MHWESMFEDLEGQLASEWESERAALDAEAERLRISRIPFRERLRHLRDDRVEAVLELVDGTARPMRVSELGADWLAAQTPAEHGLSLIPLAAVHGIRLDHGALLSSLDDAAAGAGLRERMTFGFVLRDLARRRLPVRIEHADRRALHGTIDRAGADHLDLAEHEPGTARRAQDVRAFRIVPFAAIARVRVDATP